MKQNMSGKKSFLKKCVNVIGKAVAAYVTVMLALCFLILVTLVMNVDVKTGPGFSLILDVIWILLTILYVKMDWKFILKRKEKKPKQAKEKQPDWIKRRKKQALWWKLWPAVQIVTKLLAGISFAFAALLMIGSISGGGLFYNAVNWIFEEMNFTVLYVLMIVSIAALMFLLQEHKTLASYIPNEVSEAYFKKVRKASMAEFPGWNTTNNLERILHMLDPVIGTVPVSKKTLEQWDTARKAVPGTENADDALCLAYALSAVDADRHAAGIKKCDLMRRIYEADIDTIKRVLTAAHHYASLINNGKNLEKLQKVLALELWYREYERKTEPEKATQYAEKTEEKKTEAVSGAEVRKEDSAPKTEDSGQSLAAPVITDLNTRWIGKAAVFSDSPWSKVEYLLTGYYGYDVMQKLFQTAVDFADRTERVWTAELSGMPEIDRTEDFRKANWKVSDCPQLQRECGQLSAGLFVKGFVPLKIIFLNQTNLVRIFVASQVNEAMRLKLDRYMEEILEMALNGNVKPHVERLLNLCAQSAYGKKPDETLLKNQIGRRLLAVDTLYVMMDEDFNNSFPYLDALRRIHVCLDAETADKVEKEIRKNRGNVSVKEIKGPDLLQFAALGVKIYRLCQNTTVVDISFQDYVNVNEKCILEKENREIRMNLIEELQHGYRIKNVSEEARGSDYEKNLIEKMLRFRKMAYECLSNGVFYALADVPCEEGVSFYTPKAMERANRLLTERIMDREALNAPGDHSHRVFESELHMRVSQKSGQTMEESLLCIFTDKATAEDTRKLFRKYGAEDGIIAVTFEEIWHHTRFCAGIIVDLPTYGYILPKEEINSIYRKKKETYLDIAVIGLPPEEEKICYDHKHGYFLHDDGKGKVSLINREKAKDLETTFRARMSHREGREIPHELLTENHKQETLVTYWGDLQIPSEVEGRIVNRVEARAFIGESAGTIKTASLPETVKEIEWKAFAECTNLKMIYIPGSVTVIGEDAVPGSCTILVDPDSFAENHFRELGYQVEIKKKDRNILLHNSPSERYGFTHINLKREYNICFMEWSIALGYGDGTGGRILVPQENIRDGKTLYEWYRDRFPENGDIQVPDFSDDPRLTDFFTN